MESVHYLLIGLAAGAALGGVAGWLLALRRAGSRSGAGPLEDELRQQIGRKDAELGDARNQLGLSQAALATAHAEKGAADQRLAEHRQFHEDTLRALREAHDKAMVDLREVFKGLSAEALHQAHPEFLRLANETFARFQESAKGDLAQRQESIKTLVEPLKQHLESYQRRLQQNESAQATALGEVRKQMDLLAQQSSMLTRETQQFRMVLKSNQARGRWGEETLRRVVEAAGMSAHCDFTEQMVAGDSKPDLVVRLPGERMIVVDAKVPDLDFLQAIDSAEPEKRAEALGMHAAKLRATIKALADRDYPSQFPQALDHVVLFLPAESLFSAALEGDRELIVWAARRRILLTTPASLIALLRSVSVSWQQHAQTENAREIAGAAEELFVRVAKFTDHFERIRAGLERANGAFNDAVGSYERMVRPSGERLLKLGVRAGDKALAEVTPVETFLRLEQGKEE
jgi:DNA recombination protein RmuC